MGRIKRIVFFFFLTLFKRNLGPGLQRHRYWNNLIQRTCSIGTRDSEPKGGLCQTTEVRDSYSGALSHGSVRLAQLTTDSVALFF